MKVREDYSPAARTARWEELTARLAEIVPRAPREAARIVAAHSDEFAADLLTLANPAQAQRILRRLTSEKRERVMAAASARRRQQWVRNEGYSDNTVGHMMEPTLAVFRPHVTVAEAARELRFLV